jgi:hypothetical protein
MNKEKLVCVFQTTVADSLHAGAETFDTDRQFTFEEISFNGFYIESTFVY